MTIYRYIVNNDLSKGVIKITNGIVSFVPNDTFNRDWAEFMTWYNASPLNRPQQAW